MTIAEGDIIERGGEFWVIVEIVNSVPVGFPYDALISNGDDTLRVSTAAMVAVAHATFTAGQRVRMPFWNHEGVVERDLGDVIEVSDQRPVPPLGKHAKQTFITPIRLGPLAAANLSSIVKQLGE
jgi:non-ribosomal peptide synthetase component E (peptide arylation enzyme)